MLVKPAYKKKELKTNIRAQYFSTYSLCVSNFVRGSHSDRAAAVVAFCVLVFQRTGDEQGGCRSV